MLVVTEVRGSGVRTGGTGLGTDAEEEVEEEELEEEVLEEVEDLSTSWTVAG